MKNLYESQYVTLSYDQEKSLIQWTFLEDSIAMTDEIYKEILLKYAEFVEENLPNKLFINSEKQRFSITPSVQTWVAENIAPRILCIKKIAYLVAHDLFAQISSEQLMEESGIAENYPTQYFEKQEDALNWLMK
jgi:hypothetical protein